MSRTPSILINALTLTDGGGWTYIKNLMQELAADPRGFRYTLLVPKGRLERIEGAEVRTLWMPPVARPAKLAWRVGWEEAVLPRVSRRFDILYCVADLAPRFPGTRTVVACRNLNSYDSRFFANARMKALRVLVPAGLRQVDRAIFPSRAAADLIRELLREQIDLPEERVAVVPHGIAPGAFDPPRPLEHDAPFVFLPAAIESHKNLEVLLEALPHVGDPRLEVWIAGKSDSDPAYAARLRARADELGVGKRVRFLGPVPYERVLDYYRASEGLVFPSWIETFGHPLLEAMLAGAPIVASDIGSFREIAGDVALYFPPDDPRALAAAIDEVQADPEARRQRIARGHERAHAFSWKRSVDTLCAVFETVLREPWVRNRHT